MAHHVVSLWAVRVGLRCNPGSLTLGPAWSRHRLIGTKSRFSSLSVVQPGLPMATPHTTREAVMVVRCTLSGAGAPLCPATLTGRPVRYGKRDRFRTAKTHDLMTRSIPPITELGENESTFDSGADDSGVRDPIKQYLDWIGQFPRLTREEEAILSKRALAGDVEAQDMLVKCNLRLVVTICKDFTRGRFDLLDLVSVGNEGLIVASRKYDASQGVPFGNYASIWIKQRLMRHVTEHGFVVRVPYYRSATVNQVMRTHAKLSQLYGRAPTADEIAEYVNCSREEVEEVVRLLQAPVEFDRPVKDDGDGATLGSYFGETRDAANERLEQQLHHIDLQRAVEEALAKLTPREAQVLVWCFGLRGQRSLDLDQVAHRLGVTRERARQIRTRAIRKLANEKSLLKYLKSYIEED